MAQTIPLEPMYLEHTPTPSSSSSAQDHKIPSLAPSRGPPLTLPLQTLNRPPNAVLIRDFILGFSDGLTVPFALTASLSSLQNSRLVVLAGLAEVFSGALSMGLGCYLAAVTEADSYIVQEQRMWERAGGRGGDEEVGVGGGMEGGREEVFGVFEEFGIERVEVEGLIGALERRKASWVKFMLEVSLKLEKPATRGAWIEGLVMGFAYLIGGILPMIPYFCTQNTTHALFASIAETALILLTFGPTKSHLLSHIHSLPSPSLRASLLSALHTLAVGIVAAGASYGIVRGIDSVSGSL